MSEVERDLIFPYDKRGQTRAQRSGAGSDPVYRDSLDETCFTAAWTGAAIVQGTLAQIGRRYWKQGGRQQ